MVDMVGQRSVLKANRFDEMNRFNLFKYCCKLSVKR